jgi:nicotinamidase-related amidase
MRDDIVFLDVDTQRCFLDSTGSLPVTNGHGIRANLRRLTDAALGNGVRIFATEDVHTQEDAEFAELPRHCIAGTPETRKVHETRVMGAVRIDAHGEMPGQLHEVLRASQVVFEKRGDDPFSNPALGEVVKALPSAALVVYGVATERSVARACRTLLGLDRSVSVVTDACRGLYGHDHGAALAELSHLGVTCTSTDEVLGLLNVYGWQ